MVLEEEQLELLAEERHVMSTVVVLVEAAPVRADLGIVLVDCVSMLAVVWMLLVTPQKNCCLNAELEPTSFDSTPCFWGGK
jgi:hypothetical protein